MGIEQSIQRTLADDDVTGNNEAAEFEAFDF